MTSRVRDGATIAFVVALSAVPYVGRVAFESDDWTFAALVSHATFASAFAALEAQDRTLRPVQFAGVAALALIGRASPVVDSFATTLAFGLAAIGFYLTLRYLGLARTYALAAALVAAVAPNAATNRFWAAVPANLSLSFAFASVCAGLAAARATGRRKAARAAIALACELACGLTYEVALPLFVPIAAAYVRRSRALAYATVGLACALVVGKAALETRAGYDPHALLPFVLRHATSFARVEFVELGVALPATAWTAARLLDGYTIANAAAVALACTLALILARDDADVASRAGLPRGTRQLLGWGATACVLAYAVFATDRNTLWTGTGLENRKLAAFALGCALVIVALASAFARAFGPRAARSAFAGAIGAYAFAGLLVVEVVGASHVAAANVQRRELAVVRAAVRELPSQATILVGGCDDVGPGVVFEAPWDTTAALRGAERSGVRGDVVGATTRATREGVVTRVYDDRRTYAYGPQLFGYDAAGPRVVALVDRSAGAAFVARTRRDDRDAACAGGDAGLGAPVFATDRALAGAGPLDVARLRAALAGRYIL